MSEVINKKNRLKDLKTIEVSLVERGANNKKFFLLKSEDGDQMMSPEDFQNFIKEDLGTGECASNEGSKTQNQTEGENSMKKTNALRKEEEDKKEEPQAGQEPQKNEEPKGEGEPQKEEPKAEDKAEGEEVSKSANLESIQKRMEKLEKENAELKKQNIEKEDAILTKEYTEVAKSDLSHLAVNASEFGPILKRLAVMDKEVYEKVMDVLKAADAMAKDSQIMKSSGSDNAGVVSTSAWARIEELAKSKVQKGGELTMAQAIDEVLKTEEGRKLYQQDKLEKSGV